MRDRALAFVDSLYANERFLKDLARFLEKIAYFGALSSLFQLTLKITSPGVHGFITARKKPDVSDPQPRRSGQSPYRGLLSSH